MPGHQDDEKRQLALDRIDLAWRSRATRLNLSELRLTAIPDSLAQLTNLQGREAREARDGRDRSGFAYASRDDLVRPSCSLLLK